MYTYKPIAHTAIMGLSRQDLALEACDDANKSALCAHAPVDIPCDARVAGLVDDAHHGHPLFMRFCAHSHIDNDG